MTLWRSWDASLRKAHRSLQISRRYGFRKAKRSHAAQARKVVPSCVRTPMFGDSWWTVRIDNASNAVARILAVDVTALDINGFEVPDGYRQANNTMPVDQAFDRSIRAALSGSSGDGLDRSPFGETIPPGASQHPGNQLAPAFKQVLRDAMVGHFVKEWHSTLPPNQHAVMAYTTTDPNYKLRITIDYEDEAGYQWRRTDTGQPRRTDEETPIGGSANGAGIDQHDPAITAS